MNSASARKRSTPGNTEQSRRREKKLTGRPPGDQSLKIAVHSTGVNGERRYVDKGFVFDVLSSLFYCRRSVSCGGIGIAREDGHQGSVRTCAVVPEAEGLQPKLFELLPILVAKRF